MSASSITWMYCDEVLASAVLQYVEHRVGAVSDGMVSLEASALVLLSGASKSNSDPWVGACLSCSRTVTSEGGGGALLDDADPLLVQSIGGIVATGMRLMYGRGPGSSTSQATR
jgi:hypothetical protein